MPSNRKRIQTYVSPTTYAWLENFAKEQNKSLSEAVCDLLQTVCVDGLSLPGLSYNDPYVTREELSGILDAFWERLISMVSREVHTASATQTAVLGMLAAAKAIPPDELDSVVQAVMGHKDGLLNTSQSELPDDPEKTSKRSRSKETPKNL